MRKIIIKFEADVGLKQELHYTVLCKNVFDNF
jgi:hypothetical protein